MDTLKIFEFALFMYLYVNAELAFYKHTFLLNSFEMRISLFSARIINIYTNKFKTVNNGTGRKYIICMIEKRGAISKPIDKSDLMHGMNVVVITIKNNNHFVFLSFERSEVSMIDRPDNVLLFSDVLASRADDFFFVRSV